MENDFIKIISWNINGGFSSKFNDSSFRCFILSYDIILLTECWIEKEFSLDVEGFCCYAFPRKLSKSKQGGGCVILIRHKLKQYVSLLKNMHDTVIWLKLDKCLFQSLVDIYLACVYIPPSSSTFYQTYDCDIFADIENQIVEYMNVGKIMLIGDTNARTSNANDFILNDVLHDDVLRDLGEVLFYGLDSSLPVRVNPDNVVNYYGSKLLTLCKSSGLRILNGRHSLGMDKDFTFVGPRGMSVVDYLLSSPDVFKLIDQFIVSNFNMFSDHAPLHIRLKSGNYLNSTAGGAFCENQMTRQFIWNQDLQSQAREVLLEHSEELMSCIQKNPSESQSSIDESIDMFTSRLTDLMRSCFEISKVTPKVGQVPKIPRVHSGVNSMDKPWFNEELKRKYRTYRSALCHFNSYKNKENQLKLMEAKKNYKKSEAKLKRQ